MVKIVITVAITSVKDILEIKVSVAIIKTKVHVLLNVIKIEENSGKDKKKRDRYADVLADNSNRDVCDCVQLIQTSFT